MTLGFSAALIRRILPQPGFFLVKHPIFAPLIPAVKLIRTLQIVSRNKFPYNFYQLLNLVLSLPFYMMGILFYSVGFSRGVRAPESMPDGLRQNIKLGIDG
jgi:hypothetical protein